MSSLYSINYQIRAHKRDRFIEFIKSLLLTPFVTDKQLVGTFKALEDMIEEHMLLGRDSRLFQMVPSIGTFFTKLPLQRAFEIQDSKRCISGRRFIPPSFNDIRHILNTAQALEISPKLKMITFDGDMTLYADGMNFENQALAALIIGILKQNIKVVILTAAGYTDPKMYQNRLGVFFHQLTAANIQKSSFYVMGGECNYLFEFNPESGHLEAIAPLVPDSLNELLTNTRMISDLLDNAASHFESLAQHLGIYEQCAIIRKERSVGFRCTSGRFTREILDEIALSTQFHLKNSRVPFCCFNGGSDVWLDIGNKRIGVEILLDQLKCTSQSTLHVGDQVHFFDTVSGNGKRYCNAGWMLHSLDYGSSGNVRYIDAGKPADSKVNFV
jgi:IMP and pyridine-specific 5'-nucleotidase